MGLQHSLNLDARSREYLSIVKPINKIISRVFNTEVTANNQSSESWHTFWGEIDTLYPIFTKSDKKVSLTAHVKRRIGGLRETRQRKVKPPQPDKDNTGVPTSTLNSLIRMSPWSDDEVQNKNIPTPKASHIAGSSSVVDKPVAKNTLDSGHVGHFDKISNSKQPLESEKEEELRVLVNLRYVYAALQPARQSRGVQTDIV